MRVIERREIISVVLTASETFKFDMQSDLDEPIGLERAFVV